MIMLIRYGRATLQDSAGSSAASASFAKSGHDFVIRCVRNKCMLTWNQEMNPNPQFDTVDINSIFDPDAGLCSYTKKLHIRLAQHPKGTVLLAGSRPLFKTAYHFSTCQETKTNVKFKTQLIYQQVMETKVTPSPRCSGTDSAGQNSILLHTQSGVLVIFRASARDSLPSPQVLLWSMRDER